MATADQILHWIQDMNRLKVQHQDLKTTDYEAYVETLKEGCPELVKDYDALFEKNLKDELDEVFMYMLTQKRKIEQGKVDSHGADVRIGKALADKFVEPMLAAQGQPIREPKRSNLRYTGK